jgi:hypothetical protein
LSEPLARPGDQCEETTPDSERYWSLNPSLADTDNNMIVTGVRLVKINKVFHIQIQQARALPEGRQRFQILSNSNLVDLVIFGKLSMF